jgi:RND superfamily putative drug exporter
MKLIGERNWYLPSWLEWLPNVSAEGKEAEEPVIKLPATEPVGHPAYAYIPVDGD